MPDGQRFDPEQFLRELEPVLTRPHDEVDQLLRNGNYAEQQLALHHPNLTEDHLIRYLHDHAGGMVSGMWQHPAVSDRTRIYAIENHNVPGLIAGVRDPAYLHHVIDKLHSGKFLEDGSLPLVLLNLRDNPYTNESHGRKMLQGEYAQIALPYVRNAPQALNEYAQKRLSGASAFTKMEDRNLLGHPDLNPQFLEDFVNVNPRYGALGAWIRAVAKRHPNAGDLLARNIPPERSQTVNWDDYNTFLHQALEENSELKQHPVLQEKLLSHPMTAKDALASGVGGAQTIDHLARTSNDYGTLKMLARQEHPAANEGTLNTILDREDLGNTRQTIANNVLLHNKRPLEDSTLLHLMRHANPDRVRDGTTKSFPANVVRAALNSPDYAHWHPVIAEEFNFDKDAQMALAQMGMGEHLARNEHLRPETISYLLNSGHLDDAKKRDNMLGSLIYHRAFGPEHHEQFRAVGGPDASPAARATHLERTHNPQHIREEFDKIKGRLGTERETIFDAKDLMGMLSNERLEVPDDILQAGLNHRGLVANAIRSRALSRTKQRHYDSMLDSNPQFVAERTNDPRHLERLAEHHDHDVRFRVYGNEHTPIETLKSALARYPKGGPSSERQSILDALKARDPDSGFEQRVGVRYNTGKLRRIRDYIESVAGPGGELRMKDLPEKLAAVIKTTKIGMNPKNGNVNAKLLQQHIDNQPATQYNVSHSSWGGVQRHNGDHSNVFQLNVTTDHVNQMKQAGVYDTFKRLQDQFRGHPISDTAFGWIRYTGRPGTNPGDGIFIDEVQSDHFVPLAEKARAQVIKQHTRHGGDPEVAKQMGQKEFDRANAQFSADHQKKINQILFGKKHASEVLLEAFHQHLRDQGALGTKIAIHSVHTKAPISLGRVDKLPDGKVDKSKLPGHFVQGYDVVPQSMGMEPSMYHKDNMATQDNEDLQSQPTHQDEIRKKEEAAIFQWVAMVKAEKGVHGDGIDDDFGPEVEVKLPEHAIWAEYTKRKHD